MGGYSSQPSFGSAVYGVGWLQVFKKLDPSMWRWVSYEDGKARIFGLIFFVGYDINHHFLSTGAGLEPSTVLCCFFQFPCLFAGVHIVTVNILARLDTIE